MPVLRAEQEAAFEASSILLFEDRMLAHLKDFNPVLCSLRGDAVVRPLIREGMERASAYGFETAGPIRFFLELLFALGYQFDSDPQYSWLRSLFENRAAYPDDVERSTAAYKVFSEYWDKVIGENNEHAIAALHRAVEFQPSRYVTLAPDFSGRITRLLEWMYPKKLAYIGPDRMRALVGSGMSWARSLGVTTETSVAFLIALQFALGRGIGVDPLYPWVTSTLNDPRIADPNERVSKLIERTQVYLARVAEHLEAA
jgi:hypothetical protein